jgi:hypothetical protein
MITLDAPNMGLNDARAPARVTMWNTWDVNASESREHIIDWVAHVARNAPGGKLKNVVFSCHGNASFVEMGQGFNRSHAILFAGWAGLVEKIWFRACLVARISTPGSPTFGDGNLFCSDIAKAARCHVVAPTEAQTEFSGRVLPYSRLDTLRASCCPTAPTAMLRGQLGILPLINGIQQFPQAGPEILISRGGAGTARSVAAASAKPGVSAAATPRRQSSEMVTGS